MNKKIIFLISFIIIVAGFVGFWVWRESGFSKQILRLEILGPESAKAGEEIEYTIRYKNNGNFALENPKLVFELPENSLTEDEKTRLTQDLDDIYPGEEKNIKIKARLLGKEEDLKTAKAYLSYTPKNLTARYESETTLTTKISEVPITLDFDLPTKIEKGKDFQYSLNYFSNIDYPLENLAIKISPISGLEIKSSDPKSLDNLEWKLNTLSKTQGGRININGKISGDVDQNITFSAQLGMWRGGNFVVIKETEKKVESTQSMLYISQQVNGSSNYTATAGEKLHYQIFFRNIGASAFENLFVIVNLDGSALDMSSVEAPNGQVQQSGNMIVWDWKDTWQLKKIDVQQEASVDFYVKVKDNWMPANSNENELVISDQVNVSQITQKFSIKVNSGLVISQTSSSAGDSSYMINWDIKNYLSDIKNVKVKAILPAGVNLTGQIMPSNEASNFAFDSASREIVWSAGDVLAGTGVNGDPITLSFRVSADSGNSLIGKATVIGENQFTNAIISSSSPALNIGGTQ